MNTGMQDAINLAWKMAMVCRGLSTAPALLDSYDAERRPIGAEVIAASGRLTRLATIQKPIVRQLRNALVHVLAGLAPGDFAREVLVHGLGVRNVAVGADFCFGCKRTGNAATLQALGHELGFGVTVAPLIGDGEVEYSSTAIRTALAEGRSRDAGRMLGHWHRIDGEVLHGEKRGRELGYPTANMAVDGLHLPALGIYAVLVDVLTGPERGSYKGVASLGVRPMFDGTRPNLEVFIFDFSGDLYGQHLSVALVEYLRPEMKFDSIGGLVEQMDRDSARARDILATR